MTLAAVSAAAGLDTAPVNAIDKALLDGEPPIVIDRLTQDLKQRNVIYADICNAIQQAGMMLPPSGAVAGVYVRVDRERGVWKAPADVSLDAVKGVAVSIDDAQQQRLNMDPVTGKSINAIREFAGKGILVWGARTLAGNDPEWRYIPVRRFCNGVESALAKLADWVVFEPNDATTWLKIRQVVENTLHGLWRAGALHGAKPEQAYFVKVGVGESMTSQDVQQGRMVLELGLAVIRPAEFIILKHTYNVQVT